MPKIFSLFVTAFLCFPAGSFFSYADSPYSDPVASNPVANLNEQDLEKYLKAQEDILRKIKVVHVHKERKQHLKTTDELYQEASNLYRLQRPDQAREVFSNVEYLMPNYKSTDSFLRNIDYSQLNRKPPRPKSTQDPQQVINLAQQASMLYHQAADLGDNGNTAAVKKKLNKLMKTFQEKSKQLYIQKQMDKITRDADKYDQEVFRLTQAKDFAAARRKYLEYQQIMIDELMRVKQSVARVDDRYQYEEKYSTDY